MARQYQQPSTWAILPSSRNNNRSMPIRHLLRHLLKQYHRLLHNLNHNFFQTFRQVNSVTLSCSNKKCFNHRCHRMSITISFLLNRKPNLISAIWPRMLLAECRMLHEVQIVQLMRRSNKLKKRKRNGMQTFVHSFALRSRVSKVKALLGMNAPIIASKSILSGRSNLL